MLQLCYKIVQVSLQIYVKLVTFCITSTICCILSMLIEYFWFPPKICYLTLFLFLNFLYSERPKMGASTSVGCKVNFFLRKIPTRFL